MISQAEFLDARVERQVQLVQQHRLRMQVDIEAGRIDVEVDVVRRAAVVDDVDPCNALRDVRRVEVEIVGVGSAGIGDVELVDRQLRDREMIIACAELDGVDPEQTVDRQVIACASIGV